MTLRDEGKYPLRCFALMKEVRYGISGGNCFGSKDIIYKPVMSVFYWTIPIQFLPKSGRFPPRSHSCLELLLRYGIL